MYFAMEAYLRTRPNDPKSASSELKIYRDALDEVTLVVPSEKGLPEHIDDLLGFLPRAVNNLLKGWPQGNVTAFLAMLSPDVNAVTIGDHLFFQKMPDDAHKWADFGTLFHELFHSMEQSKDPNWFIQYVVDFRMQIALGNPEPYMGIPAEVRAYAFEDTVVEVMKDQKYNSLFFKLGQLTYAQIDQIQISPNSPQVYRDLQKALVDVYRVKYADALGTLCQRLQANSNIVVIECPLASQTNLDQGGQEVIRIFLIFAVGCVPLLLATCAYSGCAAP